MSSPIEHSRLPAPLAGQLIPPVAKHPPIELSNLLRGAGKHDERVNASRGPVIEVIQTESVTHLVQQDVDVLRAQCLQEILRPDPLAPVTTRAAAHAVGQPQRLVVVPVGAALAAAVVAGLVEVAAARLGALRDTLAVDVGVDVEALGGSLQQGCVLDGPAYDVDADVVVGEAVVAVEVAEPLLVLLVDCCGDLVALGLGDGRV